MKGIDRVFIIGNHTMETRKNDLETIVNWIRKSLTANRETDTKRISFFNSIIPGCRNPLVVKTKVLEKISRKIWKDNKKDLDIILKLCDLLWKENEYYEEKKISIFILEKLVKNNPDILLVKIEDYSSDLYTWDLVDQFGMRICSELVKSNFQNIEIFSPWMLSSNFWIRRLSLVCLVRLRNTHLTSEQWLTIVPMLQTLWEDEEYYVHKAMSWCLRELSKSNSEKVVSFLTSVLTQRSQVKHINKTFIKTCIKKLSSEQQSKFLLLI